MIDFQEDPIKISGHVGLGAIPSLKSGTWNGRNLDDLPLEELNAVVQCIMLLAGNKLNKE